MTPTEKYTQENHLPQLVIDIETMPNPQVMHLLGEPKIDSRLKDPTKVKEARESAKQDQIDKMALSPLTGKIACIGYYSNTKKLIHIDTEENLINELYNNLLTHQIITYNGKNFDIPFVFKRGIILDIPMITIPAMKKYTERYKADVHIDLMQEFCNYGEYEKLDNLSKFILGKEKIEFDFTEIPELIKTAEGKQKLGAYCLNDCELTWNLAKRMGFIKFEIPA